MANYYLLKGGINSGRYPKGSGDSPNQSIIKKERSLVKKDIAKSASISTFIDSMEFDDGYEWDDEEVSDISNRTAKDVYKLASSCIKEGIYLPADVEEKLKSGEYEQKLQISNNQFTYAIIDTKKRPNKLSDGRLENVVLGVNREFENADTIHNSAFYMNEEFQGTGIGVNFYQKQEQVMMEAGVKKITMRANLDVGGYAWARMGYQQDDEEFNSSSSADMSVYLQSKKIGAKNSNISDVLLNDLSRKKYKTYELATMSWQANDRVYTGKELMLGLNYKAYKNLDPNDAGYQLGLLYYESKGLK